MSKITRRDFLKLTVVSATAASTAGLVACSGSGKGGSIILPIDSGYFPQSIASGDPKETSVILWTRILDAAKPGADLTTGLEWATDAAFTQNLKSQSNLSVLAANDNCLKIKLTSLTAGTTYYYRFVYTDNSGQQQVSNIGRTKTAPAAATDAEVNYALLSCQDYVGRYYNTLKRLVELSEEDGNDLDFVVHVGDYVYETTGDPSFQTTAGSRKVSFTDTAGAIAIKDTASGDVSFYAAQSLSNYRELYKTYRTDAMLQRVHERFAMISTWDDHEYSDDCHKDTATYFDGKQTNAANTFDAEKNTSRRLNAEQAYFDYMPVEPTVGTAAAAVSGDVSSVTTDTANLFADPTSKTQLYRGLQYGANFELLMTDYRSFRPDHPIPEGANPGEVVLEGANLNATLQAAAMTAVTNDAQQTAVITALTGISAADQLAAFGFFAMGSGALTATEEATLRTAITGAIIAEGIVGPAAISKANADFAAGKNISILFYNAVAASFNTVFDAGQAPAGSVRLPETATVIVNAGGAAIKKGISYAHFAKQAFYTSFGSRYLVVKDTYDLYSLFKSQIEPAGDFTKSGAFDNALGDAQWEWLVGPYAGATPVGANLIQGQVFKSTAKFVGIANSVSTANLIFDFRQSGPLGAAAAGLPTAFQQRFYPNADHWDGFPVRKATFLGSVAGAAGAAAGAGRVGAFFMAGDIHASLVSDNKPGGAASVPDFTAPAVASGTWGEFILDAFNGISSGFTAEQKALGAQALGATGLDQTLTAGAAKAATDAGALKGNELKFADSQKHGFVTFKVTATKVTATYNLIASDQVKTSLYDEDAATTKARFTTNSIDYTGLAGGLT